MRAPVRLLLTAVVLLLIAQSDSFSQQLTPRTDAIPEVLYGMHIHGMVVPRPNTGRTTEWPPVPFGAWRLWDAYVAWPNLEPQKGKWTWDTLDKYVDLAQQHHVDILLPLAMSPKWASSRPDEPSGYAPGWAAEPKNLDDWRNYVRTVATRYKGKIHNYEIWNEPNLKRFYSGDVQTMLTLTREAAKILKEVDSSNVIISPSATGADGHVWLKNFLDAGGGKYVNVIGYHFYVNSPEQMLPLVEKVRAPIRANHLLATPIWNTETGWPIAGCTSKANDVRSSSRVPPDVAPGYVARAYLLAWAAKITRFYWYSWDGGPNGMLECDGALDNDLAGAFAQVQKWTVGARMDSCSSSDGMWTCVLDRSGQKQTIVWTEDSRRRTSFNVPRSAAQRVLVKLDGSETRVTKSRIDVGPVPQLIR